MNEREILKLLRAGVSDGSIRWQIRSSYLSKGKRVPSEQEIELKLRKAHKKMEIGQSSISAFLHCLKNTPGLTWNVQVEGKDTFVRIKLRYRRCILIRLRPNMNMQLLSNIFENICKLREALEELHSLNLTVRNFGSNIEWTQNQATDEVGEEERLNL